MSHLTVLAFGPSLGCSGVRSQSLNTFDIYMNRHLQTYFNMIDKILSEFDGKTFNSRFILIQEGSVDKKEGTLCKVALICREL